MPQLYTNISLEPIQVDEYESELKIEFLKKLRWRVKRFP